MEIKIFDKKKLICNYCCEHRGCESCDVGVRVSVRETNEFKSKGDSTCSFQCLSAAFSASFGRGRPTPIHFPTVDILQRIYGRLLPGKQSASNCFY